MCAVRVSLNIDSLITASFFTMNKFQRRVLSIFRVDFRTLTFTSEFPEVTNVMGGINPDSSGGGLLFTQPSVTVGGV